MKVLYMHYCFHEGYIPECYLSQPISGADGLVPKETPA